MYKRCLALALALAWVPTAYAALPPCPKHPVRVDPLDRANATTTPFWYVSFYEFLGHPLVVGALSRGIDDGLTPEATNVVKSGKCEVRVPVPLKNVSGGGVSLNPVYPAGAGFGIIALPDLRYGAPNDLKVRYRLGFSVDNTALVEAGEWLDIAQLEFRWNVFEDLKDPASASTVYRIRKTQRDKEDLVIEVIETSVAYPAIGMRPPVSERVVAVIPTQLDESQTPIALRWTQTVMGAQEDASAATPDGEGGLPRKEVASYLEVIGPNGKVVYSVALSSQWANSLSMGLLDYNIGDASMYNGRFGAEMTDTSLSIE
jgi:hypothetical protein